jgi:hypothetical protein
MTRIFPPFVHKLTCCRALLAALSFMPAILDHIAFANSLPCAWTHVGSQVSMELLSGLLATYSLLTLHEVGHSRFFRYFRICDQINFSLTDAF